MKASKLMVTVVVLLFLSTGIWVPVSAGQELTPVDDAEGMDDHVDDVDQQAQEESEAEVKLYFKGDRVTPTRPSGNTSEEVKECPGVLIGARFKGTIIGTWSKTIGQDVLVDGTISVALWARSQTGAKNAGFRINMRRSGGNTQSYFTPRQDISASPVKFTVEDTYQQDFNTGDTIDVQLVWFSDPTYGVGPSGSGEFLYGSPQLDSHVVVTFKPHPLSIKNITAPVDQVNRETLKIKAEFSDYLGGDPSTFVYSIAITGKTAATPTNLGEPQPSKAQGNTSFVTWVWNHKKDGAKTGEYRITVTMSYDGNSTSSNTTVIKIKIPGEKKEEGGILGGEGGMLSPMMLSLIAVVIVVVVVAVLLVRRRKKSKAAE